MIQRSSDRLIQRRILTVIIFIKLNRNRRLELFVNQNLTLLKECLLEKRREPHIDGDSVRAHVKPRRNTQQTNRTQDTVMPNTNIIETKRTQKTVKPMTIQNMPSTNFKAYSDDSSAQIGVNKKKSDEMISSEAKKPCSERTRNQPTRTCKNTTIIEKISNNKTHVRKRTIKALKPKIMNALMPSISKFELVWGYVKGFPSWPAVVEGIQPDGKYLLHFFGDYSRYALPRKHLTNYFEGFDLFSCNFGNMKLRKAVEEAKNFLLGNERTNDCFECKILEYKTNYLDNFRKNDK